MNIRKLTLLFSVSLTLLIGIQSFAGLQKASAVYDGAKLIDNGVFLNTNTMNAAQIQSFLSSMGSGLASRSFVLQCYGSGSQERQLYSSVGAPCDQNIPASQIIYYASIIYGINPQVTLATLQKEQSLITTQNPTSWQLNQAMGYGCPTTGNCSGNSTFSYQIDSGVWALRYHYERANGNNSWWSQSSSWVCGTEKNFYKPNLYPGQNVSFYDGNGVLYRTYFLANAATSSMYCYTPHAYNNPQGLFGRAAFGSVGQYYTGSYNFVSSFETWFGSTLGAPLISYKSHVGYVGWTGYTVNSGMTGTTGQSKAMEAFKINGAVEYSSYNLTTGWQPTVSKGMISGTTGMNKPIQAIKINPIGSLADNNDIYYRAHISNIGWMGWAKNGQTAGITGGAGNNIEAFEIITLPKGAFAPGSTDNTYQNISVVNYNPGASLGVTAHVGEIGWQPTVTDTMVSGTTEQNKQIEAIKIDLNNNTGLAGGIKYSSHLAEIGWQDFKSGSEISGTTGQSRRMEALRIALTGNLSDNYDIWYRGYVQYIGWLDWGKNGEAVGSVGAGRQLEAIETRIVPKNSASLPQQNRLYNPSGQSVPDTYSLNYSTHVSYIGWINNLKQNAVGGVTGQSKTIEALTFNSISSIYGNLGLTCAGYVKGTGWTTDATVGNMCGTTGQYKNLEAVKLTLTGDAAGKYDLYYKTHLSWVGWQDWVKNGVQAGTPNEGKSIEAIVIKLVQK